LSAPRGWAALVLVDNGNGHLIGARYRSPRLHWDSLAARQEAESWVGKLAWETVDYDTLIARQPGRHVVVASILLPEGAVPARPQWVWMIYQPNGRNMLGAFRRCDHAHWTTKTACKEVQDEADRLQLGHIMWDKVDDRTLIGRSPLGYIAVVTSALPPVGPPP
jgi:hypothetical protein